MAESASRRQPSERDNGSPVSPDPELARLRSLLIGPEREQITRIEKRLVDPGSRAEDVGEVLAEAFRLCSSEQKLRKNLLPVVEEALRISVRANPRVLAEALYPSIGSAVRKAVAAALESMVQSVNMLMEKGLSWRSLRWRWEALRTGKSFGEIALLRSLLYRVEQVFLIHRPSGLLLQHVSTASAVRDADVVSAMLTAIGDFVRDSFGGPEEEELNAVEVGDLRIWIVHGPRAVLAAVIRGTPPRELGAVLHNALEQIHREQRAQLDVYKGDPAPFEASRKSMEECLQGAGESKPTRFWPWVLAAASIVVLIAGVFFVASWISQERRWQAYVDLLRVEPGIIVTHASGGDGDYLIAGLRDPLAREPAQLMDNSGIQPADVTFQWETYHSFHPAFQAEREIEELAKWVEGQRVHFPTGSAEITPQQLDAIAVTSSRILTLLAAAEAAGKGVTIQIRGGADPRGTGETNLELAETRANRVRTLLIEAGVEPSHLANASLVPEQSPQQRDTTLLHALARSVSFRVHMDRTQSPLAGSGGAERLAADVPSSQQ